MKMRVSRLLIALLLFPKAAEAQTFAPDTLLRRHNSFLNWCSPEKLYLHIDRSYYAVGETLWFMGYLSNASSKALLPESNYIYVELLDAAGENVARVKVKRTPEGFPGAIEIPEYIESGWYTLRAYTLWQLNAQPDFLFNQRIKILGEQPLKSPRVDADRIDISFYPEGGRYFSGQKSRIGFKSMDKHGRSAEFSGWLVDSGGGAVFRASTSYDGMGVFDFVPVAGESYYLEDDKGKRYPLPPASTSGASLNVSFFNGDAYLRVCTASGGRYLLFSRNMSESLFLAEADITDKSKVFRISEDVFPVGINHLVLTDIQGNVVSERLFYRYGDEKAYEADVRLETSELKNEARALLEAKAFLEDGDGQPLDGNFSVSVIRGSLEDYVQEDNLISYMRLSSELKGHINNPKYYFDRSVPLKRRAMAMDMLMMIQGWSYYSLKDMTLTDGASFKIRNMKEYTQFVTGRIDRILGKKMPKEFLFSVIIPRQKFSSFRDVDQARYFIIDSLDFEENTGFFIKVDRHTSGLDYMPRWNGDEFAPKFVYPKAPGLTSVAPKEEKVPIVTEGAMADTLQAAVVTASVDDPLGGMSGRRMDSADLRFYSTYSLVDYVKMKVPNFDYVGEYMINKRAQRANGVSTEEESETAEMTPDGAGDTPSGAVKLVVDDSEQPWWMFESVYLEDIAAVSVSTSPDFLYSSPGGLVAVKMKSGAVLERQVDRKPSLLYFVPLGYQTPQYFYSPRYDRGDTSSEFDHRNTIFWAPAVKVQRGLASFEFCDTDQMDYPYIVNMEGRTSQGLYFSHSCIIGNKKNH